MFEIPAGGRRYRALELLVKQRRLARDAPIPCVVRTAGLAEEDSLAENIQRAPLHPLDQFRAFQALREKGRSEEEISVAFFVSLAVVRQRLRRGLQRAECSEKGHRYPEGRIGHG
jgi:ParB family chromosome partitioning protein